MPSSSTITTALQRLQSVQSFPDLVAQFEIATGLREIGAFGLVKDRIGVKTREKLNDQAREIVDRVQAANGDTSSLTDEDKAILMQYSGRGGLTENSQYEYFTPAHAAEGTWDLLKANGFENGNVLEPSAGAGVFNATKPPGVLMTATEIDKTAAGVNQILHPEDTVLNQSFEKLVVNTPDNHFDAVIGNVPFGDARGASAHDDPQYKDEKRIERYFMLRTIDKVKPGGLITLVVPINIVGAKGTPWSRFRREISRKAEFLGAHKLPSKTFGKQGTDVVTDIIVLRKHSKDLLNRIDDLPLETLSEAQVYFDEFIEGKYWAGEGKPFIMGKFVPKDPNKKRDADKVISDLDNAGVKRQLARKFKSRIDWDALDSAEPMAKNYSEGDRRFINNREHEFSDGIWIPVDHQADNKHGIDEKKYGVASIESLKGVLSDNQSLLESLTAKQAFSALKAWPDLFSGQQRDAIEFAMSQPSEKYREQVFRGTLIGSLLAKFHHKVQEGDYDPGDQLKLQAVVSSEVEKYGHPKGNKGLLLMGEKSRYFGMFANAMDESGNFSDLLEGQLSTPRENKYDATNIHAIVEELFIRQGIQEITLEDIQQLYQGQRTIKSLGDLTSETGISITAEGFIQPSSRYYSGDIYSKIAGLSRVMAEEKDIRLINQFQQQIDEFYKRRPTTSADNIAFGMQQRWFDRKYVLEFLRQNGYRHIQYLVEKKEVKTDPDTGEQFVDKYDVEDTSDPFGAFTGLDDKGFPKQLMNYLSGGSVTSSKQEKIKEYKDQVQALEEQFRIFMQQHEDIDEITEQYNQKFNGYIVPDYDGSDLELKGVSPRVKPHLHQNSGVRRMSEEGRGILAFDVGLGKTFSGLALAAYNKQMGRANKTLFVVPNNVLGNWYHESKMFYGHHNDVLFVGFEPKRNKEGQIEQEVVRNEEGQPKKNKHTGEIEYQDILTEDSAQEIYEKMHLIPQTNKSVIVMTAERFGMIPLRPASKARYADKWQERSLISDQDALQTVTGEKADLGRGKTRLSYSDAKRQDKYRQAFSDDGTKKKGEYPYFEEMGFESVIVDEGHHFKNSYSAGKESEKIEFLSNPAVSQRAMDMAMKMSYLRDKNNDRGPVILTATPVTNSPLEIFNMLSLVIPIEEFERYGVYTADDFVRVFGQVESIQKATLSGEIVTRDGLTGFKNLDGLRNLFHRYTLMKNMDDLKSEGKALTVDAPEADVKHVPVALSEEQDAIYDELRDLAKEASKPKSEIQIFSVLRDMERVTTDLDLFKKTITFVFPANKKTAVESLMQEMPERTETKEFDPEAGKNVVVAVDLDYEISEHGNTVKLVLPDAFEDSVVGRLTSHGLEEHASHPISPKYAAMLENLRTGLEGGGKQIIFTDEKTQHRKLARIISHHLGIDRNQIGLINGEDAKGKKLQRIADAYNSGKLKIVIANKKAEVGVNLQKGTSDIHHLTLPWTPAALQQRNGRGVRQGNTLKTVRVHYYLGKGSIDEYRLQSLQRKSSWMRDLFNGNAAEAENGNAALDDFSDAFEKDPEEAKRKRMERLAQAQEADRLKKRQQMLIQLNQVQNLSRQIAQIPDDKEDERRRLAEREENVQGKLDRLRTKATENPGDEELQKKVKDQESNLLKIRHRQSQLDAKWDEKHQELDGRLKQRKAFLKAKEGSGELPFDAALLDSPENGMVQRNGSDLRVIQVGQYYEFGQIVIRIESVDPEGNKIDIRHMVGRNEGRTQTWDASQLGESAVEISLTDDEIAVRQILSKQYDYASLKNLDKELALKHLDKLQLTSYQYFLTLTELGELEVHQGDSDLLDKSRLLWPEPDSDNWKKSVAIAYLKARRSDHGNLVYFDRLLSSVLGYDFLSTIESYGNKATDSEIRQLCAQVWNEVKEEEEYQGRIAMRFRGKRAFVDQVEQAATDNEWDNKNEITLLASRFADEIQAEREEQALADDKAAERAKMDEIRNHPDFKEVPENIAAAFNKLGITVKYNHSDLTGSGRRRSARNLAQFKYLLIYDENGKEGKLFEVSRILKARYKADWIGGIGGEYGDYLWWYVPSSVDIQELYELIA